MLDQTEQVARWLDLLDEMEDGFFEHEEGVRADEPELGIGYDEDHATLESLRVRLALLASGEPVGWQLQARTPADHEGQEPSEWRFEDVAWEVEWRDKWLADPRGDELRAIPLYLSAPPEIRESFNIEGIWENLKREHPEVIGMKVFPNGDQWRIEGIPADAILKGGEGHE